MDQSLDELLAELNFLEQQYGRVLAEADPRYRPSGEVNAQVASLKETIASRGAEIVWDGSRYQLVKLEGGRNER